MRCLRPGTVFCCVALCLTFSTVPGAAAEKGDWLVRLGASNVDPDASSGEVTGIPDSGADADDDTQISFTLSYMVSDRLAVEVLAALPFEHGVSGTGSIAALGQVAEIKHLPPTLSLQYHFAPQAKVRPYVGVGLNFTLFFEENASASLEAALGPTEVDLDESFGLAAQAGLDIGLRGTWFLNFDVRWIDIETTATLNSGGTIRDVDVTLDPLVTTLSFGRSF